MTLNYPKPAGGQRVWIVNPDGEPVPIKIVQDEAGQSFVLDEITGALVVMDIEHHEVHEGELFRVWYRQTGVNINVNVDVLLSVPNQNVDFHFEGATSSSGGAYVQFYENVITSDDGSQLSVYNAFRRSTNTNILVPYIAPTITNLGTLIDGAQLGSGQTTGGVARGEGEWVLNKNRKYLLRITSAANGSIITARLRWYEESY